MHGICVILIFLAILDYIVELPFHWKRYVFACTEASVITYDFFWIPTNYYIIFLSGIPVKIAYFNALGSNFVYVHIFIRS